MGAGEGAGGENNYLSGPLSDYWKIGGKFLTGNRLCGCSFRVPDWDFLSGRYNFGIPC